MSALDIVQNLILMIDQELITKSNIMSSSEQLNSFGINDTDYELLRYDNKNIENKELREDLLNNNLAMEISRNVIRDDYVKDVIMHQDMIGFVAKMNEKYSGFVLYKPICDTFYLSLIATKPQLGIPLGKILMQIMENEAIDKKIIKLQADAGEDSVGFYKKLGWHVVYFNNATEEYAIQKDIYKFNDFGTLKQT
eukprot:370559_1